MKGARGATPDLGVLEGALARRARAGRAPGTPGKLLSYLPLVLPIFRTFCSRIGEMLLF